MVYLTIGLLFKTPKLKQIYSIEAEKFIALTGAAFWALHPIQTQAVTYIVQRMALMAGLFSILGFYFYLRFRLKEKSDKRFLHAAGCFFCFIAAIGSKENAFLFPLNLFLVEFIFFKNVTASAKQKKILSISAAISCAMLIAGFFLFLSPDFFLKLNEPGIRYFTPIERVMTQPRVLLFYISQLFFPHPSRFSIEHDFDVSTSLFHPWTTLPSIVILIGLILFGIRQIRRQPMLAFAILFFFVNHTIESSFIQLELVFEHRNYLPSMFAFIPIASGCYNLVRKYQTRSSIISWITILVVASIFTYLGWGTYARNEAYKTKKSLLMDTAKKAPGQARPLAIMAIDMARSEEATIETQRYAYSLLRQARNLAKPRKEIEADIIGNMALIHHKWGEYEKALQLYEQALDISPKTDSLRLDMVKTLLMSRKREQALHQIDILISKKTGGNPYYLHLKGVLLLWMNQPAAALKCLQTVLHLDPNQPDINFSIGVTLLHLESYKNAKLFLRRAAKDAPQDILPIFALIDLSLNNHETSEAEKYTKFLFSNHTIPAIISTLKKLPLNFDAAPIPSNRIQIYIERHLVNKTDRFFERNNMESSTL